MDLYKLLGITEKNGDFEGKPWHNLYFHCSFETNRENSIGSEVETIKIKADDVSKVLGSKNFNHYDDFVDLIDKQFYCIFNRNGIPVRFDFVDKQTGEVQTHSE